MAVLYKNAPLKSASFEARFHGDVAIETRRHEFQRLVKPEFPLLYVPQAAVDKAPALQHYQFRKEDSSAIVMLAVNSFVYTSNKYPGFENFKRNVERVWAQFNGLFEIPNFTRLGLRYINHLPIIRDERGAIPLSRYVTANLKIAPSLPDEPIYDFGTLIVTEMSGGRMRLATQNEQSKGGVELLVMDFDFFRAATIGKDERQSFVETAHGHIETLFLDLISPDYKKIMERGSDEQQ